MKSLLFIVVAMRATDVLKVGLSWLLFTLFYRNQFIGAAHAAPAGGACVNVDIDDCRRCCRRSDILTALMYCPHKCTMLSSKERVLPMECEPVTVPIRGIEWWKGHRLSSVLVRSPDVFHFFRQLVAQSVFCEQLSALGAPLSQLSRIVACVPFLFAYREDAYASSALPCALVSGGQIETSTGGFLYSRPLCMGYCTGRHRTLSAGDQRAQAMHYGQMAQRLHRTTSYDSADEDCASAEIL